MELFRKSRSKSRSNSMELSRKLDSNSAPSDSEDEEFDIHATRCEANRKKIGIYWKSEKRQIRQTSVGVTESSIVNFILTNFALKKCTYYKSGDGTNDGKCFCGDSKENHDNNYDVPLCMEKKMSTPKRTASQVSKKSTHANATFISNNVPIAKTHELEGIAEDNANCSKKWSEETEMKELLSTNAFGSIDFGIDDAKTKPAKYIRISDDTSEEKVIELIDKHWNMLQPHRPSLIISVAGGAKNFRLDGKKRKTFNRGLIKAAQSTHAWIITSGFNMGVMQVVGDAVKENQSLEFTNQKVTHSIRCIGIGHWGYVKKREDLQSQRDKNSSGCWPASYSADPVIGHGQPVSLEPNHTHFIFVDDGYRNIFRPQSVANFRAKLERKITQDFSEGGLKIPVVAVLVEGGIESFHFVKESVYQGIPVVLCRGTGRAADILSYAHKHYFYEDGIFERKGELSGRYRQKIHDKLTNAFKDTLKTSKHLLDEQIEAYFDKIIEVILDCCRCENMIVVFDTNYEQELDLAILSALLKGRASKSDQLSLALKWNRSDVAAQHIFTQDAESLWTQEELNDAMLEAIKDKKLEFVKLLVQHGVIIKNFLTVDILQELYNVIKNTDELRVILHLPQFTVPLEIIYRKIEKVLQKKFVIALESEPKLTRSLEEGDERPKNLTLSRPYRELLLWAVLTNK